MLEMPATSDRLGELLLNPDILTTEQVGVLVDFSEVECWLDRWKDIHEARTAAERATMDRELVEPLHSALRHVPRRLAADIRLWHWLCIAKFPEIVWYRWHGSVPQNPFLELLTPSLTERFLGSRTLRGVSRNTMARLWWCGEALFSDEDGYSLAREALSNQDFFQAIFERQFGLYPPAARACLSALRDASEGERREATRRLNHYLTTVTLETLTEEDIVALIQQ